MNNSPQPPDTQQADRGRAARKFAPRSSHGRWSAGPNRPDPVEILEAQNARRIPWLVPIRRKRVAQSPFAFFRGGAAMMAADLAGTPVSGIDVQTCGDAHLANFGVYASPERQLVFDINDFDETYPGPWEWDVKRLATSFVLVGRQQGLKAKACRRLVRIAVRAYRDMMRNAADMRAVDVWYANITDEDILSHVKKAKHRRRIERGFSKARSKDSLQARERFAEKHGGGYRIRNEPPLMIPLSQLTEFNSVDLKTLVYEAFSDYIASLPEHRQRLIRRYTPVDVALKVVGVGSVGTKCFILLLEGDNVHDPLLLQVKEAVPSVLETYVNGPRYANQGQRVVEGQQIMQSNSDIFLGWARVGKTDFYWRQLRDWKGSFKLHKAGSRVLRDYAALCGMALALAHARSGGAAAISAYLGKGQGFDRAVAKFADRYSDQVEEDYREFVRDRRRGRVTSSTLGSGAAPLH